MKLVELSISKFKGHPVKFEYETDSYYKTIITSNLNGFNVVFMKEKLKSVKEKSFTSELYKDHWENPNAYGYFDDERLVAVLEVTREVWNKRLRITNISVDKEYRRRQLGKSLMDKAKLIAKAEGLRAIILETQTFNTKAIDFYLSQGFVLGGFDSTCYSNEDIEKNEVRIELVYIV